MKPEFYQKLTETALSKKPIEHATALKILTSKDIELLPLLGSAFAVRKHFVGESVTIHIINNGQNGHCPEDCHYCAQAKTSKANIEEYPIKSDEEFLKEAESAYKKGAHRYCMVFAGRGPSTKRVERLAGLIKQIKEKYSLEVCVSAGLLDDEKAAVLKNAGLDRLNHNLNTSKENYPKICTTHTYEDRIQTLKAARNSGIQLCSGAIIGMGEDYGDIINIATELNSMKVESIPVNFLIPIEGTELKSPVKLTPEFCLRVLCLFRFINPSAEIRIAAGREIHLRSMEVMSLYPANSLFLDGYLNAKGEDHRRVFQMIKDAGFTIESNQELDDLIKQSSLNSSSPLQDTASTTLLKDLKELRPFSPTSSNS